MALESEELLPYAMDHLPSFFVKKATIELNETSEKITLGLLNLKQLAKDDDTLCEINLADDFLVQFLRHAKYDIEKAFSHLKNFIKFKRKYDYLFASIPEQNFSEIPSCKFSTVLPFRCPDGCTIVYSQLGIWDPSELSFDDMRRLLIMLFIQSLCDPMTQINGFKIIYDFNGTSMKHLKYCTPRNLHFQYHFSLDCLPARIKEIHLVNDSVILSTIWATFKMILPTKIKSRVFFHSKAESLFDHFPRSVVPAKYGGDLTDCFQEDLIKQMNREYGSCPLGGQKNYY